METPRTAQVRMFGRLYSARREAGLPTCVEVEIPEAGISAIELACDVGLDPDAIEGVFVNRVVHDVNTTVNRGDRVAFVPPGTPGPHRYFLGLYSAGRCAPGAEQAGVDTTEPPGK